MSWEEVKKQTEALTKSFEEFKNVNDERISKVESGVSASDLEAQTKKYDVEFSKIEEKLEGAIVALNRSKAEKEVSTGEAEKEAKELSQKLYRKGELTGEESKRFEELNGAEYKLLSSQNDNEGGYTVRPEVSNRIQKRMYETSTLRALADSITIGSDSFEELYDNDEADAGWVGETQERTESRTNKLNMIRIPVHEMYSEPKATQKLLDDAFFDIESWHQGKVSEKFSRSEATAFIRGNGILQPKGILSYSAGDGFDKLEQVSLAGSTIVSNDLISLQDSLFEEFQANASFLMKRATRSAVRKLKDADGRYLFSIDKLAGINGGAPFMLLGKAIHLANDMDDIATGKLPIAYGDFRAGYKVVDRMGIRVIRDSITQKGFVKFYTTKRVGGGVQQFQAIKLLKA